MSMTREEMQIALSRDEPDYAELAGRLDASDLPLLREFAASEDLMLATKAVYLASLVPGDEAAADIVDAAARSQNELLRIAAASALSNIASERRNGIALTLIDDSSIEIQKLTLRAIERPTSELQVKIEALANATRVEGLRDLAQDRLRSPN
jgi:HEAT repeat protein